MVDLLVNSEANARRIALVESCFGSAGQPLGIPDRVLVGEGMLTKACRKKPKPRQFFLFNDCLVYGNILINKKKYNKQHLIPLEEVKLKSLEDDGMYRNGWLICTRGKSFAVYAATLSEKQDWMAHLNKCISECLDKSGKPAVKDHAAVWVPDSEASHCMLCKKVNFSMIQRRHHCRKCGSVVCGGCSTHKMMLPSQSYKPLRVCSTCFTHDEKKKDTGTQSSADLFEDTCFKIPKRNSKVYKLVNISQRDVESWWNDEGAATVSAVFGENFEEDLSDGKTTDSSGDDDEEDSEEENEVGNDVSKEQSDWYADSKDVVATLPGIAAKSLNLSPLSHIGPLPRVSNNP